MGAIAKFDPGSAFEANAVHDARIQLAARAGNTDALEREIDKKLDDLEDVVNWWRANVRVRGRQSKVAESATMLFAEDAQRILGFDKQTISRWAKRLADRAAYREAISRAARKKLKLDSEDNHRAEGTGENEWYTPATYIEAARRVLGKIDLDPASTPAANETVGASKIYTMAQDGLTQKWTGRVWLNPPYAQPLIGQFIEKLCEEYSLGNVPAAILLTHNYTDTAWFHCAEAQAAQICFTRGRISFVSQRGESASPTQGQAFFYFGDNPELFIDVFREFGFVR